MNSTRIIFILILGVLIMGLKLGQAAQKQVQHAVAVQEEALNKALSDME